MIEKIDYRMWLGLIIHCVFTFVQLGQIDLLLFYICLFFFSFNLLGLLLIILKQSKLGSILFMIGCVGFVPIGLIGIFGARKFNEKMKETEKDDEIEFIGKES